MMLTIGYIPPFILPRTQTLNTQTDRNLKHHPSRDTTNKPGRGLPSDKVTLHILTTSNIVLAVCCILLNRWVAIKSLFA